MGSDSFYWIYKSPNGSFGCVGSVRGLSMVNRKRAFSSCIIAGILFYGWSYRCIRSSGDISFCRFMEFLKCILQEKADEEVQRRFKFQ